MPHVHAINLDGMPSSKSSCDEQQKQLAAEERRLIATLPWKAGIFLPTNKIPLQRRIEGLRRVKGVHERWEGEYAPRLRALRERYKDTRRCFIIGNGPSLNDTDLSKLRHEVTFGVNGIFLKFNDMGFRLLSMWWKTIWSRKTVLNRLICCVAW